MSRDGRFVVLSGSNNPRTAAQLDHLLATTKAAREAPPILRWDWAPAAATAVGERLAQLASQAGTIVVTGGDTAQWFVDTTNIEAIRILGDTMPGIPYGIISGGTLNGWHVVTKAGGFGEPDVLSQLFRRCTIFSDDLDGGAEQ